MNLLSTQLKAVVFDFDGTLVQSNDIKIDVMFEVIKELGDVSGVLKEVLNENPGDRFDMFRDFVEKLEKAGRLPSSRSKADWIDRLVTEYSDECERRIVAAPEIEGATEVLEYLLKKRIPVYLNSATPEEAVQAIIHKKNWDRYFKKVLGRPKSKVENANIALRDAGAQPSEIVFIGDTEPDRAAAEQLKCSYIGLETAHSKYKMAPMRKIKNLKELLHA